MPPLILSVGLLAPRKGHDVLLNALAMIDGLDWQAEIIGKVHDPAVAVALEALVAAKALPPRVRLAGELDPAALNAAYRRASIFALATRYEGYGMVFGEAMLYGLPIVSCRVGAVPETVGDAGILVPPDDPHAFAAALGMLLQNPTCLRRYSSAALQRANLLPSWEETALRVAKVIERVRP